MTGKRGGKPTIPNTRKNQPFENKTDTSSTVDAAEEKQSLKTGTNSINLKGLEYTDIVPRTLPTSDRIQNWSLERIGSVIGILLAILAVVFFFNNMDSKIDVVTVDVKEVKDKIERLDENENKQTSSIDNITSSVQRLENENRRTQDYVRDRKK